ncbi:MAG: TIGR00725 family protein [Actinomycetota bacterium]|nr:TIGR00725 family protein [Actinomycetota bacterium]
MSTKLKNVSFSLPENLIKISVIGGSDIDNEIYNLAYDVGREIAKSGAVLICGGLAGTMEAACKGAKKEGGLTIGILPTINENDANRYVDIKIPAGIGYARNMIVVLSSHAVIAVDGSSGTLSEIAYALTFKKPVIGLKTWELRPCHGNMLPDIIRVRTAKEAVNLALEEAKTYLKNC